MTHSKKEKARLITNYMERLGINKYDAEELYKFDYMNEENETVNKIEAKGAPSFSNYDPEKRTSIEKVRHLKAKPVSNASKDSLMEALLEFTHEHILPVNPQQVNASKISFSTPDGEYFTISLTKHRSKPDGYKG